MKTTKTTKTMKTSKGAALTEKDVGYIEAMLSAVEKLLTEATLIDDIIGMMQYKQYADELKKKRNYLLDKAE